MSGQLRTKAAFKFFVACYCIAGVSVVQAQFGVGPDALGPARVLQGEQDRQPGRAADPRQQAQTDIQSSVRKMTETLTAVLQKVNRGERLTPAEIQECKAAQEGAKKYGRGLDTGLQCELLMLQAWAAYFQEDFETAFFAARQSYRTDKTNNDAYATQAVMSIIMGKTPEKLETRATRPAAVRGGGTNPYAGRPMERGSQIGVKASTGHVLEIDVDAIDLESIGKRVAAMRLNCLGGTTLDYDPAKSTLCILFWQVDSPVEPAKPSNLTQPTYRGVPAEPNTPGQPMYRSAVGLANDPRTAAPRQDTRNSRNRGPSYDVRNVRLYDAQGRLMPQNRNAPGYDAQGRPYAGPGGPGYDAQGGPYAGPGGPGYDAQGRPYAGPGGPGYDAQGRPMTPDGYYAPDGGPAAPADVHGDTPDVDEDTAVDVLERETAAYRRLFSWYIANPHVMFLGVNTDPLTAAPAALQHVLENPWPWGHVMAALPFCGAGHFADMKPARPTLAIVGGGTIRYAGPAEGFMAPLILAHIAGEPAPLSLSHSASGAVAGSVPSGGLMSVLGRVGVSPPSASVVSSSPAHPPRLAEWQGESGGEDEGEDLTPENMQAERKLGAARDLFIPAGRSFLTSKRGVDICREIIRDYPNTKYAQEARLLLRKVPEQDRRRYNVTDEEMGL